MLVIILVIILVWYTKHLECLPSFSVVHSTQYDVEKTKGKTTKFGKCVNTATTLLTNIFHPKTSPRE